ncbi:MAG: TetR/AcrR family transcriptional regulator [Eubacteriales bacterium]|nr:TetR/AcrR family transcriptional regulator [Eubacteriales bacterium]
MRRKREKTDRRTLITCGMIRNALLELLKSTSYSKITVALLCRQAGITRATFYQHYENIDVVVDELPACRRAASNTRYRTLFMDDDLSPLILKKLYEREHDSQTARIKELYHVNQKDADMILMKGLLHER